MKRKGLYVLATAAMLVLAAGCGNNPGEGTPQNQVTEAVSPTEAPEAIATTEPTATPAPTATPKPVNYMEANGIEVLGGGWHTGKGFMAKEGDENGNPILELVDREYCFEVMEEENEGGTKVIQVVLHAKPHVNEHGGWSTFAMGGFVDLQTGKAFFPMDEKLPHTTLLKHEEKEYELQLTCEFEHPSVTYPYYTERYTLVCPSDYEDAGFYMTGYNYDWETFIERAGLWKKLNFIRHGDSELLVFGVNKGLVTEPEKKPIAGAELAEENYFEANGFSTKGEGEYTWRGTEAQKTWNDELGHWETVSLEAKEITSKISLTEESLGDGTKCIRWSFTDMAELESEAQEVRVPYTVSGIADKKTGLVYPTRTYNLAESYVLEKDGEEFAILVGVELDEEEMDDGKVRGTISYTLICPEDYGDAVFYLSCRDEIIDEYNYSDKEEVYSLHEIDQWECDLLFFR